MQMLALAKQKGFTLLEVLVATFIFAIAVSAMVKVLGSSGYQLGELERRHYALLVAHNQLALAQLGIDAAAEGSSENGGYRFEWRITRYPTEFGAIDRLEIYIQQPEDKQYLVALSAFDRSNP